MNTLALVDYKNMKTGVISRADWRRGYFFIVLDFVGYEVPAPANIYQSPVVRDGDIFWSERGCLPIPLISVGDRIFYKFAWDFGPKPPFITLWSLEREFEEAKMWRNHLQNM